MTAIADKHSLVDKAREVIATLSRYRQYAADSQAMVQAAEDAAAGARRVSEAAILRENLTRAELTSALHAALTGRAEALSQARERVLSEFVLRGQGSGLRRRTRLTRVVERAAARLGVLGRAWVTGRAGLRRPVLFDAAWYLERNPDVAGGGASPLAHYLVSGSWEGRSPHPAFDEAAYRARHAQALAETGVSGLEHYLTVGAWQGASPHPLFDVGHYLLQTAVPPGEDPLSHYLRQGWRDGLSPHPLFDPAWYAKQAGDSAGQLAPLLHYLTVGWRDGLSPHPLFDPAWYLRTYPEVAAADVDPLTDFLHAGAAAGRSPSAWFDAPAYAAARGQAMTHSNPLVDYLQGGAWSASDVKPGVATAAYLAARPQLARRGLTPLEHWARQGRY